MNSTPGSFPKALLIGGAGLLLAVFLGISVGSSDYEPLLIGALIVIAGIVWFSTGRFFWVLTIASSFLAGTFPILGGAFNTFQILVLMGLAKFLVEDVVLRRTSKIQKNRFDLLMIAGFMTIVTIHGVNDRFGMRFLGSNVWGGHNYVNVYAGLAAFFAVQSIPAKPKLWNKLPYLVLVVVTFDLTIAGLTALAPKLVYVIYPFYSAVSSVSFQEAVGGPEDITGRVAAFSNFGFVLILLALSSFSIRRAFEVTNLHKIFVLVVGFVATLLSGFRSAVLSALIAFVTAGVRDLKIGALILLPVFAALLFSLSAMNSVGFQLPKQVQRALAFLPGDWDLQMTQDAAASNDFRKTIWKLWAKEYFPARPYLGRGFGFRSEWAKSSMIEGQNYFYQQMVETGNLHNGLFAALDTFGVVGTIFFAAWNISILISTFRIPFSGTSAANRALRFLALYLAVSIVSYWGGASSIGGFLPTEFAITGAFYALRRTESAAAQKNVGLAEKSTEPLPRILAEA